MDVADIRRAVYLTVHEFPKRRGLNSVETAALALGRATGTVYNKADPGNDQQCLTLNEAVALMNASDDFRILHALCSSCDHSAVYLAPLQNISDLELLDLLAKEQEAAGRKAEVMRRALDDGRISSDEFADLDRAFHDQVRATLELLSRLKALARQEPKHAAR